MRIKNCAIFVAFLLFVSPFVEGQLWSEGTVARAGSSSGVMAGSQGKQTARTARRLRYGQRNKRSRKRKICRRKNNKRRCRWVAEFTGHGVPKRQLRIEPLPRPSGELRVYAVNFREEVKVNIYDEDGEFNDEALARLDHLFRCKRSRQVRAVDPYLYEILSIIYDHFGQRRIELISGFRKRRGEETSRHFHGSAMDIRIPGVSTRRLYEFATTLDSGGMGVGRYPESAFVHVDFRAPGTKSYRWLDYSAPGRPSKRKARRSRRTRPSS